MAKNIEEDKLGEFFNKHGEELAGLLIDNNYSTVILVEDEEGIHFEVFDEFNFEEGVKQFLKDNNLTGMKLNDEGELECFVCEEVFRDRMK